MKTIKEKINEIQEKNEALLVEAKNTLMEHLDELIFVGTDDNQLYCKYTFGDHEVRIWTAFGPAQACFWKFLDIELHHLEYSDKDRKRIWDKTQADIKKAARKQWVRGKLVL